MVSSHQVHLEKDGGPCQVGREVLYMRNRIPVGGRGVVQAMKIAAGAPTAISLSHHVQGGGPRAVRVPHDAVLSHCRRERGCGEDRELGQ